MANTLAAQMTLLAAGTPPAPGFVDGGVKVFNEQVTLASQAIADTIEVGRLPKGAIPLYGILETDTSLGSTLIAIGVAGTAGKYRASALFTATATPTMFGDGGVGAPVVDEETVIITVATAPLPASGTLRVMLFYAFD